MFEWAPSPEYFLMYDKDSPVNREDYEDLEEDVDDDLDEGPNPDDLYDDWKLENL